eukprot:gene12026-5425_t
MDYCKNLKNKFTGINSLMVIMEGYKTTIKEPFYTTPWMKILKFTPDEWKKLLEFFEKNEFAKANEDVHGFNIEEMYAENDIISYIKEIKDIDHERNSNIQRFIYLKFGKFDHYTKRFMDDGATISYIKESLLIDLKEGQDYIILDYQTDLITYNDAHNTTQTSFWHHYWVVDDNSLNKINKAKLPRLQPPLVTTSLHMRIQLNFIVLVLLVYLSFGKMIIKNDSVVTVASFFEQFNCTGEEQNYLLGCRDIGAAKMFGRFSGTSLLIRDMGSFLTISLHSDINCRKQVFRVDWRKGVCYSSGTEAPVLEINGNRYWRGSARSLSTSKKLSKLSK